jgi:Helix-turn-helix domain
MAKNPNEITRLDYWKLVDRVACSGDVSPTAVIVLMRLLQHRHTTTGQCNPSIETLATRLFPNLAARSGYDKVQNAIRELKKTGIIQVNHRFGSSSVYLFKFGWGWDVVNASLSLEEEDDDELARRIAVLTTAESPCSWHGESP